MKQPEDDKTIDLITAEQRIGRRLANDPSYGPTPEQKEAMRKERQRELAAARQAKYRKRAEAKGDVAVGLMLSGDTDRSLQTLCVHHGCDRRQMIEALISQEFARVINEELPGQESTALIEETIFARTRKHRVMRVTE